VKLVGSTRLIPVLMLAPIAFGCAHPSSTAGAMPTKIVSYCGHKFVHKAAIGRVIDSISVQEDTMWDVFPYDDVEYELADHGGAIAYYRRLRIPMPKLMKYYDLPYGGLAVKAVAIIDDATARAPARTVGLLAPYPHNKTRYQPGTHKKGRLADYQWIVFLTGDKEAICSWLPF